MFMLCGLIFVSKLRAGISDGQELISKHLSGLLYNAGGPGQELRPEFRCDKIVYTHSMLIDLPALLGDCCCHDATFDWWPLLCSVQNVS